MKQLYRRHKQKIHYLIVGGWNTLFGYGMFVALYYLLNQWLHYMIIMLLSHVVSITNAYFGYKFFVFKTKGNYLREYLRFYIVYGVGLLLNLILLPIIVECFSISPVIGQAFVISVIVIVSFFGHKHYSFSGKA